MKREIKFRVWNGAKMITDVTVGKFGSFYVNPMNKGNGLDENDSACLTPFNTKYPDDTPVMQFIGMEDCNGKEIYEGDILEWTAKFADTDIPTPPKRGQVKYNHQGCVWHINYENKGKHYYKEFSATLGSDTYRMDTVEVVGNIYESSPDLLIFND